jgi:hypothetical protein
MKHAGEQALEALEDVLQQVRKHKALTEKKRGVFYKGSSAFLHFHEDPAGLFADLRAGNEWTRFPLGTQSEKRVFLSKLATITGKA